MEASQETIVRKRLWSGLTAGLFFLLFYLDLWLVVDPRLVFHGLGTLFPYSPFSFHMDGPFLLQHLMRVGGLVEYATRLLTQFFGFGWAGALVVTAAAWCLAFATGRLIRRGGWAGGGVLAYVPATVILAFYSGYDHPLGPILSLLTALGGFAFYVGLAPKAPIARVATLAIACPVLYYAAGAGSLLFAVLVAIDELLIGKRKWVAGAALACALVVPWVLGMRSGRDFVEAYAGGLASAPGIAASRWSYMPALYLFFPTVLVGSVLRGRARAGEFTPAAKAAPPQPKPANRSGKGHPSSGASPSRVPRRQVLARAGAAVFFCGIGATAWLSLDSNIQTILEMDYDAQHERWSEVLRLADRLPEGKYSIRCNRNIMLALYHSGRLGDEMFRYPQRSGADLYFIPNEVQDHGAYLQESQIFLELGQINLAERCAYEALAASEQPEVLEQLALIHAIKGQPETARAYLNALAKHPFHGQAAREMLHRLEADPALENDPRASRIRENMATRDRVPTTENKAAMETSVEDLLKILLDENPHNQMAFEPIPLRYFL